MLGSLFNLFDNILILDIETTGFDAKNDEMIEVALLHIVNKQSLPIVEDELNFLIELTSGKSLPTTITNLTGITEQQLLREGIPKEKVCAKLIEKLSCHKPLIVAFNAQFDLCFLY